MIGGFADWYGITAFFRKPLGIPFRTELIPKGRQKIFACLADMVENELLSTDALLNKLDKIIISEKLIYYLENQGGKKEFKRMANKLANDILRKIEPSYAASWIDRIIRDSSDSLKLAPIIDEAAGWLLDYKPDEKIIATALDKAADLLLFPEVRKMLEKNVEEFFAKINEKVEQETAGTRMFLKIFLSLADFSQVSPVRLSARILTEGLEYISKLKKTDSPERNALSNWLAGMIRELRTSEELVAKAEEKKTEFISRAVTSPYLAGKLSEFLNGQKERFRFEKYIDSIIDKIVEDFAESKEKQERFDSYVKNVLAGLIEEKHGEIGRLVKQKLDLLTNNMLVDLIEDKAGNDLQIIRINGSIVGGLTGAAIYLVTFWI